MFMNLRFNFWGGIWPNFAASLAAVAGKLTGIISIS